MKAMKVQWFALGFIVGAVLMGSWFRLHGPPLPPPPNPDLAVRMFARGLDLSPEQYAAVRNIIVDNDVRFRALFDEHEAKMKAFRVSVEDQIRKLLDEKQRAVFDRRMAEKEARWRRRPLPQ